MKILDKKKFLRLDSINDFRFLLHLIRSPSPIQKTQQEWMNVPSKIRAAFSSQKSGWKDGEAENDLGPLPWETRVGVGF